MILLRALQVTMLLIASQFFICVFLIARLWRPSSSRTVNLLCLLFFSLAVNALVMATPVLIQIYTGFRINLTVSRIPVLFWCRIASVSFTCVSAWCLGLHLTGQTGK